MSAAHDTPAWHPHPQSPTQLPLGGKIHRCGGQVVTLLFWIGVSSIPHSLFTPRWREMVQGASKNDNTTYTVIPPDFYDGIPASNGRGQ